MALPKVIKEFVANRRVTLLGVGPMSQNCVDAAVELANEHEIPLMLIASRRQIDSEELGGGYVNGWTTEAFAAYVAARDRKRRVVLARDHGGPWQNPAEARQKLPLAEALASAKRSYEADIRAGFQILHIDTSVDIFGEPSPRDVLERVFELYEFCHATARSLGREVAFEIGTEEQSGVANTMDDLERLLSGVQDHCTRTDLPQPAFVVVQTGTKVLETRNVGSFDSPFRIAGELPAEIQVPRMLNLCRKYKIAMKQHNTDYLSDETLSWHPKLGIHAANVAPEFGVAETRAFVEALRATGQAVLLERFLALAFESHKWDKWMAPGTTATDFDRAVIAGHYVFSDPEFGAIKAEAKAGLNSSGLDLDHFLRLKVKASIFRYVRRFNLVERR